MSNTIRGSRPDCWYTSSPSWLQLSIPSAHVFHNLKRRIFFFFNEHKQLTGYQLWLLNISLSPPLQNLFCIDHHIFKQVCRSKHDQNSKIKSIKISFSGLACSSQHSRKSKLNHTPRSDKLTSAKYSDCLLSIANFCFIQVLLKPPSPHPSKISASRKIRQPCQVWWGGIL